MNEQSSEEFSFSGCRYAFGFHQVYFYLLRPF